MRRHLLLRGEHGVEGDVLRRLGAETEMRPVSSVGKEAFRRDMRISQAAWRTIEAKVISSMMNAMPQRQVAASLS